MADTPRITINRNDNYRAFEADTSISASTATESIDLKASADFSVSANLGFTAQIAGVKIDARLLAISVEGDFGKKFEFLNGVNVWGSTAKGSAFLTEADAVLAKAEETLIEVQKKAIGTSLGVAKTKKSGVSVRPRAMTAIM